MRIDQLRAPTSALWVSPSCFGFGLSGCSTIASMTKAVGSIFSGPEVEYAHQAPASEDLPNTHSIAIARVGGKQEDADAITGHLGTWIASSGRFELVERERLETVMKEKGCSASDPGCLSGALTASARISLRNGDLPRFGL